MERRKFLIGAGSAAVGSSALIGSGAFTSVRADRTLNVETAGDAAAYLSLNSALSPHAEETGDTVEFQFDGSGDVAGEGLNEEADTTFSDVLRVENKGADTVRLQIGDSDIGQLPDGPMVVTYSDESNEGNGLHKTTPFASSPAPDWWDNESNINNQDLGPGEDLYIHFGFYLNSTTKSLGAGASTNVDNVPSNLNFYADDTSTSNSNFS